MLFVLGDNRLALGGLPVRAAGRASGFVPEDKVIGKAFVIVWPPSSGDGCSRRDLDRYEARLRAQGFVRIAGADEAGRGALAGPLVAAAVVLPDDFDRTGIRDSKLLTAKQREVAIRADRRACVVRVAKIEPDVIDARGLHRTTSRCCGGASARSTPCPTTR